MKKLPGGTRFVALCAIWISGSHSGLSGQERHTPEPAVKRAAGAVEIQMKNVNLLLSRNMVLGVRSLRGQLQRTNPEVPVTFDDSDSFAVDINFAEIHITTASLSALMNEYVFAFKGAAIKNVTTSLEGRRLIQTGTMHKGINLRFKIEASLSVTEDGNVRVHAEKINVEHLQVKGLLHFLGEDLEKLIHENPGRGVRAEGDDLILIPEVLTPPPHIHGRVTRVSIRDNGVVLVFDSGRHPAALEPPFHTGAYVYHRGGILRFGKLTMNDADLEIVGDRPGVFNFFQREYKKQLVAGYSKNTAANGLVAHMVDYSHFQSPKVSRSEASKSR